MCFSTVPSWYPARPRSSDSPVFETGDPRYSWINEVQAVGKGVLSADKTRLGYEIYDRRAIKSKAAPLRGAAGAPVTGFCAGAPARHGRAALLNSRRSIPP